MLTSYTATSLSGSKTRRDQQVADTEVTTFAPQDLCEENCSLVLGDRANLPRTLAAETSAAGLPFVPYHDEELRRRRKGRPMPSAYAATSQVLQPSFPF